MMNNEYQKGSEAEDKDEPQTADYAHGSENLYHSTGGYSSEDALKLISDAKALGTVSLDLSQKKLTALPEELFDLQQIQYLYLEGNLLEAVPADLFEQLPNLTWLDLRYNQIKALPPSCGKHRSLQTLLLEGNLLAELPPELGLATTLTGLSLRDNPLEFPPRRVLEKGVKEILKYLRDALAVKDQKLKPTDLRIEDLSIDGSVSSDGEYEQQHELEVFNSASRGSMFSLPSNASDLEFPRPTSVSLHKHISYEEYRQLQYEKFKRAGALGVLGKDRRRKKKGRPKKPKAAYVDPLESRFIEDKRLEKIKRMREKQALMEQRMKDQKLLEDWRDESKEMQRKHYIRAVRQGKMEFTDPSRFPYGVDDDYMKIMSREERIKKDLKDKFEKELNSKLVSRQKSEKAKLERDKQLMEKIKQHTQRVQERKARPLGNPQEQMEAAKRDLELANKLQGEVASRRRELEYRFRAFTGDSP